MGSRIALSLSINHPEMVDSLILCSPNPGGKYQAPRKSDAYAKLTSEDMSVQEGLSLIFPNTLEGHAASASFVMRLTKAIADGSVPDDLTVSKETVARQIQALKLWDENNHADTNLFLRLKPLH